MELSYKKEGYSSEKPLRGVRTDPFGLRYLILSLFVLFCFVGFFLYICNFMVIKPNKVKQKQKRFCFMGVA